LSSVGRLSVEKEKPWGEFPRGDGGEMDAVGARGVAGVWSLPWGDEARGKRGVAGRDCSGGSVGEGTHVATVLMRRAMEGADSREPWRASASRGMSSELSEL